LISESLVFALYLLIAGWLALVFSIAYVSVRPRGIRNLLRGVIVYILNADFRLPGRIGDELEIRKRLLYLACSRHGKNPDIFLSDLRKVMEVEDPDLMPDQVRHSIELGISEFAKNQVAKLDEYNDIMTLAEKLANRPCHQGFPKANS